MFNNLNNFDTKEVHSCVAKGFSSEENVFEGNVAKEHEVQTEKENLPNCNDCQVLSKYKNDLKVHFEMYTC